MLVKAQYHIQPFRNGDTPEPQAKGHFQQHNKEEHKKYGNAINPHFDRERERESTPPPNNTDRNLTALHKPENCKHVSEFHDQGRDTVKHQLQDIHLDSRGSLANPGGHRAVDHLGKK